MRVVTSKERSQFETLAATVITLRKLRGWSQAELASYATKRSKEGKVSAKTVSNIEKGRHLPTAGKLKAVADAFDIEVWQLFLLHPIDLTENGIERYYRQLRRLTDHFRGVDPGSRDIILSVARNAQKADLSEVV